MRWGEGIAVAYPTFGVDNKTHPPDVPEGASVERRGLRLACLEAVQTQYWSAIWTWHEGHFALTAALSTRCRIHLAGRHALLLALIATVLAALRCRKTFLIVEILFTCSEGEHGAAVAAGDLLITGSRNLVVHRNREKRIEAHHILLFSSSRLNVRFVSIRR